MTPDTPEFSREVFWDKLHRRPAAYHLVASPQERAALAERFGLDEIGHLEATLDVSKEAGVAFANGRLEATAVQRCAVSAEPVPVRMDVPVSLRFVEEDEAGEEIELGEEMLDEIPVSGDRIDLGEAVAESFYLQLDPYPLADPETVRAARKFLVSEEEEEKRIAAEKRRNSAFRILGETKDG